MRGGGVEPPNLSAQAPHACVSAIPPPARVLCYSQLYNLYLKYQAKKGARSIFRSGPF
jgi:hypothetical protein